MIDTLYDLGNPFRIKPNWKARPLCYLSQNKKWQQAQKKYGQ